MHTTRLRKHFSIGDILITLSAILLLFMAGYIHNQTQKPSVNISKQDSALNINQGFLTFMSLGNKRLISDILWIQTLLESDIEHYANKDLNSWMYIRFNTISILDPLFYENYLFGGQLLSIVKDDLIGADEIFSKGLQYYPDDFELNYHAGFNLYFEMGDFKKGYERLSRIVNHPKASWTLKFLVNKLNFENIHDYETTMEFLKFNIEQTKDELLLDKLKKDLYAVKAQRDLECLNENKKNCDKSDSMGKAYIKSLDGKWISQEPFQKYRIHLKQ